MPMPTKAKPGDPAPSKKPEGTPTPQPFADEVDRADRTRPPGENRRIDAEEAGAPDDKAHRVDRVHGLSR
jgi:hypothetical protein